MDLKEKLARLDRMTQPAAQHPSAIDVGETSLPGEECMTEAGLCWRNRTRYRLSSAHGTCTLGDILKQDTSLMKYVAKTSEYTDINLENLLFVDTESTGLSGGVGTLAFLVGIGYFDADEFRIDQYIMRDFSEEMSVLWAWMDRLGDAIDSNGGVVSYNGKSYDLPLLTNRATIHRLEMPVRNFPHIDVLHAARRLWKYAVPECSLTTIESKILQIERIGDVPGYMIPAIYFNYLRTGNGQPLLPVLYHNQMDILTMVGLVQEMLALFAGARPDHFREVDWLKMGECFASVNSLEEELSFYHEILDYPMTSEQKIGLLSRIATTYKRNHRFEEAVPYWQKVLSLDPSRLEAYEELAKAYEHKILDLKTALDYTSRALENLSVKMELYGYKEDHCAYQSFLRRSRRLKHKIRRIGEGNGPSE